MLKLKFLNLIFSAPLCPIWKISVPIRMRISWTFQNTPYFWSYCPFEGSYSHLKPEIIGDEFCSGTFLLALGIKYCNILVFYEKYEWMNVYTDWLPSWYWADVRAGINRDHQWLGKHNCVKLAAKTVTFLYISFHLHKA